MIKYIILNKIYFYNYMNKVNNSLFSETIDDNVILFGEIILASLTQMAFSGYLLGSSFNIKYVVKEHHILLKIKDELQKYLAISIAFVILMSIFFYIKSGIDALIIFILINIIIITIIYFDYINAIDVAINIRNIVPDNESELQVETEN